MMLGLMSDGILSGSVSDMHRVRTSTIVCVGFVHWVFGQLLSVLELDACVSLFGVCCKV